MAASLEETNVTYGELAEIEAEFDVVETEISESFSFLRFCASAMHVTMLRAAQRNGTPCIIAFSLDFSLTDLFFQSATRSS